MGFFALHRGYRLVKKEKPRHSPGLSWRRGRDKSFLRRFVILSTLYCDGRCVFLSRWGRDFSAGFGHNGDSPACFGCPINLAFPAHNGLGRLFWRLWQRVTGNRRVSASRGQGNPWRSPDGKSRYSWSASRWWLPWRNNWSATDSGRIPFPRGIKTRRSPDREGGLSRRARDRGLWPWNNRTSANF
jgi:hypothetical protein